MIIGAHMSIAKGFANAVSEARTELDANAMQIFLKSPRGGESKPLSDSEAEKFHENVRKHKMEFIVGHGSYLLNLAKPLSKDKWELNSLVEDLEKLHRLGGSGLVYHTGKRLALPQNEALEHLVENLKSLMDKVAKFKVPLLLENLSGQGTEMGLKLEELREIIDKVGAGNMLKVCLDTCHAFASGYDISTEMGVTKFFKEIESILSFENLVCFHFNDSKFGCGERKDRHENLGKGKIGESALKKFLLMAGKHKIPIILETPLINDSYLTDIRIAQSWARGK